MRGIHSRFVRLYSAIIGLSVSFALSAQRPEVFKVWPDGATNSNGATGASANFEPKLTVYKAANPNGLAILCLPGGGYAMLATTHEGYDMADWYNSQGITYGVLEYRLPNGHSDVPLSDVQQAFRIMRAHASEWGFKKLGIMGSSAGGHLASTAATHYTADCRPDFQILFYPVISMDKTITHISSHNLLLGENATEKEEEFFSNEKHVTADTPPAFIMHCSDDDVVNVENSLRYYKALIAKKVPASMHIYPEGGHGWGFKDTFKYKRQWTGELEMWLREQVP